MPTSASEAGSALGGRGDGAVVRALDHRLEDDLEVVVALGEGRRRRAEEGVLRLPRGELRGEVGIGVVGRVGERVVPGEPLVDGADRGDGEARILRRPAGRATGAPWCSTPGPCRCRRSRAGTSRRARALRDRSPRSRCRRSRGSRRPRDR